MADRPGYLDNATWAARHVERLRARSTPDSLSKDEHLFLLLSDIPDPTPTDTRSLAALIRVERAKETMRAGRGAIRRAANAAAKVDRKARDHERFKASGLLTMVGLLNAQTGKPTWNVATLLGALDALADTPVTDEQRTRWTERGDELLRERVKHETAPESP